MDCKKDGLIATSNQLMNLWVGDFSKGLFLLIGQASGENRAYLTGVLAGINILQDEWLRGSFENEENKCAR